MNDFVNLGNPTALQFTGSMTVSAWVYATSFPSDDAAVVSKRTSGESGYQLDITTDTGPRTIGFKLTNSSGGAMFRYGATTLQLNTWYHVAGVYNATNQTLDVYLNGALDNGQLVGTVTSSQQNSTANVDIGRRAGATGFEFAGRIDDVRIADHALTQAQIQTDMATPLGGTTPPPSDTTSPNVSLTPPASILAGTVNLAATASDNVGVVGVKFLLDANTTIGAEDTTSPYGVSWNTTTASNGTHTLTAQARDAANNIATSTAVTVTVDNQAPTGTVVINGGAAATNSTTVTLTLTATDAVTSVTQMRFSNNGTSFSTAETFAPTKAWTLSNGAGTKTVYVQFRDAAGNWSTAATDTIVLDTTAPTISGRTATNITGSSAQITWTTNEAATSRVEYGLTTSYGSLTTLDATLVTAHSVALTGLAPNTTYNYRVRSIDAAGNEAISANSTFRTTAAADTMPPSIPTGLTATAVSSTQINLSWNASTDNVAVTGYQVFRNSGSTSHRDNDHDEFQRHWPVAEHAVQLHRAGGRRGGEPLRAVYAGQRHDAHARHDVAHSYDHRADGICALSGTVTISANASDNVGVRGVTFLVDNAAVGGGEDTTSPYSVSWDTTTVPNGVHTIIARARDTSGNTGDSLPVSVTVSNTQLAGLVAAYSFDEGTGTTANNSSGQANTATLNNGVAWVAGQHGKAASFDGVNDYITIPNSASTNISGSALTLSMWINPQPLAGGDSVVIGKFWNTTQSSPYYQYGLELGGGNRTDFYVGTASGPLVAIGGTTLPSTSGLTLPSPSMARRSRPMSMALSSTRKRCRRPSRLVAIP